MSLPREAMYLILGDYLAARVDTVGVTGLTSVERTLWLAGVCPLLQVFDMPTSLRFYRDVLGLAEVSKSGHGDDVHWARLRQGEANLMLNTAYDDGKRPPTPDTARVTAHADTGLFMDCEDLEAAYAYLLSHGVKAQPPKVAPYGMKQLYVTDPDGYELCFQWPVTPTEQHRQPWSGEG